MDNPDIIKLFLGAGIKGRQIASKGDRASTLEISTAESSLPKGQKRRELTRTGVSRDSEDTDFTGDTLMLRASRVHTRCESPRVNFRPSVLFLSPSPLSFSPPLLCNAFVCACGFFPSIIKRTFVEACSGNAVR